jgi:hypothetical protein
LTIIKSEDFNNWVNVIKVNILTKVQVESELRIFLKNEIISQFIENLEKGIFPLEKAFEEAKLDLVTSIYDDEIKEYNGWFLKYLPDLTDEDVNNELENFWSNWAKEYIEEPIKLLKDATVIYANPNGIATIANKIGDKNPTIIFRGTKTHQQKCEVCTKIYCSDKDHDLPKPYKFNEIYLGRLQDPKNIIPSLEMHPECPYLMSYLVKGFGYDENKKSTFLGFNYDYYAEYWGKK